MKAKFGNHEVEVIRVARQGDKGYNPARGPQTLIKNHLFETRVVPTGQLTMIDEPVPAEPAEEAAAEEPAPKKKTRKSQK